MNIVRTARQMLNVSVNHLADNRDVMSLKIP